MVKAKRIAAAVLTASLGAAGLHAQDPPAKEEGEAKPPAPEIYQWSLLDFGWGDHGLSGNAHKFSHYATAPTGLFFKDLWFAGTDPAYRHFATLSFRGEPDKDSYLQGSYAFGFGSTVLEAMMSRTDYYDDTPVTVGESRREIQEALLKQRVGGFGVSFRYRMDEQNARYEGPKPELDQRTRFWDLAGQGIFGETLVGLGLSNTRFMDYSGGQPSSEVERWYATASRQLNSAVSLTGSYSQAKISQSGIPGSKVQAFQLAGDWDIGPATSAVFNYRQDWLDLPLVHNAYVKRRVGGSAQLLHRWDGWTGQLTYRHREAERVRADHTFVDVPIWDTFEGKLSRKLAEGLRMTLRGSYEHLSGSPVMETEDSRALYWRNRKTAQVKFDRADGKFAGYGSLSWRQIENDARSFELSTTNWVVGGSYEVAPNVDVFGEYSLEENSVGGAPVDIPSYSSFFPSGRVFSLGVNWTTKPNTWWSAGYTDFTTDNDNPLLLRDGNVKGRFFTLSVNHRTKSGNEFGLTYAPWRYEDSVASQMDYTTNAIQLTAKVRF
jgi:predicted porin